MLLILADCCYPEREQSGRSLLQAPRFAPHAFTPARPESTEQVRHDKSRSLHVPGPRGSSDYSSRTAWVQDHWGASDLQTFAQLPVFNFLIYSKAQGGWEAESVIKVLSKCVS